MKSCHILAYSFLFLITFQTASCQVTGCCSFKNSITSDPAIPGELFIFAGPIDNTTWFNKEWLLADLSLSNGEIARNRYIKYNGLLDELLLREPESSIIVKLDKSAILQFHFLNNQGDTTVYFRRLNVKRDLVPDSTEIFGEEIYRGKLSLYVFHTFYIERREVSAKNGVYFQNDIYTEVPIYYFRFMNNKTIGMKSLNRKSLYVIAPEKKEEIDNYYKKNKPGKNFDKSGLIRLTQFLSSIVNQ
jgi:hypothetical protein